MRYVILLFTVMMTNLAVAMPPECNLNKFPDFWADAQERVGILEQLLVRTEAEKQYSKTSAKSFRQSVALCKHMRKAVWDDPSGNGGTITQMKCEAILICARIQAIEMKY